MAINQPTYKPIVGTGATNKKITDLSLPTPNTEVSHLLQDGIKGLMIRSRTLSKLKMAFISGESGTNYVTINEGAVFHTNVIEFTGASVYLQSDSTTVVEILELYS